MTELYPAHESLDRLLKLAHADAAALRIDLADIERARIATEASLTRLAEIAEREAGAKTEESGVNLAHFEGARERRLQLQGTLLTLVEAETRARERLDKATAEIEKFERLVTFNADAALRQATGQDHRAASG